MYEGWLKPLLLNSATNTYYFTLDTTAVNLGADGSTNTTAALNGKISMAPGVYNTSRTVTAAANTNWQTMMSVYGPAYATAQTLTAPAITIGTRDANGTSNPIYWKADVYDYDPAGAAGNGQLLWSTTGTDDSHPSVAAGKALTFSSPAAMDIPQGHRLKTVISCRMTSTNSSARFLWGSSTNYSFMTVTEAAAAANTVAVTNLADYNGGALASVQQGEQGVAMLRFDLYANAATDWTGGLLDKIGSNANLGDVTFSIYKDSNGNGAFDATTDALIGGPYNFTQATASGYTLATAQTLTATPQRYFVIYNVSATAATATTVGARIAGNSYFTVTNGLTVTNASSVSSSLPTINGVGTAVSKTYMADWDSGTTLLTPESGGPSVTNSGCNTAAVTEPIGTFLVGLANYPTHSCTSTTAAYHYSSEANPKFVTLYFNGPAGYASDMTTVAGTSFKFKGRSTGGSATYTVTLFYVKPDGTRVNSGVSSTVSIGAATTTTLSLAGQSFSNVPFGSRLGVQIGVSKANAGIVLGGAVGAQLVVAETAAANTNVNAGDGKPIANAPALANSGGNVVDSFTLTSPSGNQTVTSMTITGNAATTSGNVALVHIYADGGTLGVLDGDTELGSATFSGNSATITGLNETVGGTIKNYLVVYDITGNPTVNAKVSGRLTALGGVTLGVNADSTSALLTVTATTNVTNGAAEPANSVVPSGGAAVNLDAFGLSVNGGANDPINTVTVSLAPAGISAKVAMVEIVDAGTGTVYGQLTAPAGGGPDDWRVNTSVSGLAATPATTECYVRITPKSSLTGASPVTALVTNVSHGQAGNGLNISDSGSATVTIDAQSPVDGALTAASGAATGSVQLNWTAASDPSGLSSSAAYKVVRGGANAPVPSSCSSPSAILVYQGQGSSSVDSGLTPGYRYYYRVCATDVVGNSSAGATGWGIATVPTDCTKAPSILVNPTSKSIKPGQQATYTVVVSNQDTGSCPNTDFTISIGGAEDSVNFATPSTFANTVLTLGPNGSGNSTTLTVTAKANAAQGASDVFNVHVTAPGHAAADSPAPVQTAINKYGSMLHSSMVAGTRHGVWGTDYTCTTCHTDTPTPNIMKVAPTIGTPNGNRPVVFSIMSAAASVFSGVLGNDRRSGTASTNVCEVCHHNTRFHQYSSGKVTWKDHNNSQPCIKCHPHNNGFAYLAGASCDDCHGNPPTSFVNMVSPPTNALFNAPNPGAHNTHAVKMGFQCTVCHSNSTANPMGNGIMEMGFNINGSTYLGFQSSSVGGVMTGTYNLNAFYHWSSAAGTTIVKDYSPSPIISCNVYCHGNWEGSNGLNSQPNWTGAGQAACGTCHGASGANPPLTGSHDKHASTAPGKNGIACGKCHGFRNYSSDHINGSVQWDLSGVSAGALYRGLPNGGTGTLAPTDPANYGSCSNLYCHSNVQGPGGVGGPTSHSTPTWGGVTVCGSCHVNMYNDPAATGGHVQHAQNPDTSFDCRICHGTGGDANPQNHANGSIDLAFQGNGANTAYSLAVAGKVTPGSGYGSCSTSNCHGRRSITWGPSNTAIPNLCDKCHGSATTAAFYSTEGPGSATAGNNTDPYVGAHDQHIKSAPYNYTTASDCSECHVKPAGPYSPGHIDSALPAEVTFAFSGRASSGVLYGYTSLPAYNPAARQCSNTWCHGAGMDSNRGSGAYAGVIADGGSLGTPVTPTWNQPLLNGTPANDCTRCHNYPPPAPTASYTHWGKTPTDCNICHTHVKPDGSGFLDPSKHLNGTIDGCGSASSCHANPPVDAAGLVKPAINALSLNAGAHSAHYLNPGIGNNCSTCHNGYTVTMPSNALQIGFNGYGGVANSGTFYGYTTLTNNVYVSSSAGTIVRRTNDTSLQNRCSNVYCHGGGSATLSPIGGGSNTTPDWEGTGQATCGSCHGTSTTAAPTAGSHGKHALSTGLGLSCDLCHGVKTNNYHSNGNVEWHLTLADPRMGANATYMSLSSGGAGRPATGVAGPNPLGYVYGSCNNVYCHSNGQAAGGLGAPDSYKSQQWGVTGPLACNACHKDMATDATGTGSHLRHAKTQAYACAVCHTGAGSGTAKHADKNIDLSFSGTAAGSAYSSGSHAAGSTAYGTCSTSYCHSNAQTAGGVGGPTSYGNPTWGNNGSLNCASCHLDMANDAVGTGSHLKHAKVLGIACATCHNGAGTGTTLHANKTIDIAFSGSGAGTVYSTGSHTAGTVAYGSCSTSYCHSNGQATPSYTNRTWGSGALPANCTGCHDTKRTNLVATTLSGRHDRHMNYSTNSSLGRGNGFNCVNCHARTVTNSSNTVISNPANHANGFIDFSSNRGGGSAKYSTATKQCTNIYCHSNGNPGNLVFVSMTGSKTWTGSASFNCNGCHGRSNAGTGAPDYGNGGPGVNANSHNKHVAGAGITDTKGCANCHAKTVSQTVAGAFKDYTAASYHLNGTPNLYFKQIGSSTGSWSGSTCSATYCHGAAASPAWGTTTSLNCNQCHSAKADDAFWAANSRHSTHYPAGILPSKYNNYSGNVSSANTYRFTCSSCHYSGKGAVHAGGPANASGAAQVFFGFTSATLKASYSYGATQGATDNGFNWTNGANCSTTYCHSNGQGGAPRVTSFTWASATGTLTCAGCHDSKRTSTTATTLSGKHDRHMNYSTNTLLGRGNGLNCVDCHARTVTNATNTAIADKSKHINKFIDFSSARGGGSAKYNAGTKSCSNIYCHSNGNPGAIVYENPTAWNSVTTYGCNGCHGKSNTNTGAPDYANGYPGNLNTANSHAKHVTQLNITDTTGCSTCHVKTANMTVAGRFKDYTAASYHLNRTPNVAFNGTKAGVSASWSQASASCSTVTCHSNGRGTYQNPTWGQTSNCNFCHRLASLSGAHKFHIYTSAAFLPTAYNNYTANRTLATRSVKDYNFGCSNCHPLANGNHTGGTILIDLTPAAGTGKLRSRNSAAITTAGTPGSANTGTSGSSGSSITCFGIYCHSNGGGAGQVQRLIYSKSPDWYQSYAGIDKCAMCHGNSPNAYSSLTFKNITGSAAHYNKNWLGFANISGGHSVAIHYKGLYVGNSGNGTLPAGASGSTSHGNTATSTTINCSTCHNQTVTTRANDKNIRCVKCHTSGGPAALKNPAGGDMQLIANPSRHVNGSVEVAFDMTGFQSKAQVRDNSRKFQPYSSAWSRSGAYKSAAGFDQSITPAPTYTTGGNCSNIACHNGVTGLNWGNTGGGVTCSSCHTSL